MKKIIYRNSNEVKNFDLKRFEKSIAQYAKVSEKEVKEALAEFDQYETMHVSCLVEVGMKLIGEKAGDKAMKEYFDEHSMWFDEGKFERLRRITGYLVGTLDRWNDAWPSEVDTTDYKGPTTGAYSVAKGLPYSWGTYYYSVRARIGVENINTTTSPGVVGARFCVTLD